MDGSGLLFVRVVLDGSVIGDPLAGHPDSVRAVAIGRVGALDVIVSASHDSTARVWDAPTGDTLTVQDTLDQVTALAIAGHHIAVAARNAIFVQRLN
jgi:WD40 repeat protein